MRISRLAAMIILPALAVPLSGCSLHCPCQRARVVDPGGTGQLEAVTVRVDAVHPCRVRDLTIHREGSEWILGGTVRSCRHLHGGPIDLTVQALDQEGRLVASRRVRARHRGHTRRHHGCPRAHFRLVVPPPGTFHQLVLSEE